MTRYYRSLTFGDGLIMLFLTIVFILQAYPFFYILSLAVMPYEEYVRRPVHAWPAGFTTLYFEQILRDVRIIGAFKISILKTVSGTALSVVVTTMAAYALSRPNLHYARALSALFLVPLFLHRGLIPYYVYIKMLGLLNTFWVLILPGMVSPFYFFVARAYFADYPHEIIEAATIDGAGQVAIFWRIIWPTSTPLVATLALLYGTAHWNEYFWPSILVQAELQPATVVLQGIVQTRSMLAELGLGTQLTPESLIAAMAAILIVPVLIIYPFLQRYVVRGILLGAVKG